MIYPGLVENFTLIIELTMNLNHNKKDGLFTKE